MEQDNKERLIFYKRITPYYTQEKVTETVKVDTDNTILSTHAQEPVITQIYATETETGYTKVEKIEYDAVSGISATTVTRIVNIPDDITKDCKLTMQDLDDNFLTLKDFDIKEGYYDIEKNEIHLVRNNPDLPHVIIPMTGTTTPSEDNQEEEPPQVIDQSVKATINNENGSITLTWLDTNGQEVTATVQPYVDKEALKPKNIATVVPEIDKAITKNEAFQLVHDYPLSPKYGDRYILTKKVSICGILYPYSVIEQISENLASEWLIWRIPSLEDYETLINNLNCPEGKEGLALKAKEDEWNGLDELNFHALPTLKEDGTDKKSCVFCTSDGKTITLTDADGYTIGDVDENGKYSIRLVANIEDTDIPLQGTTLNILGNTYFIRKIGTQYWIDANLNYDIEGGEALDFESDFAGTTEDKVYVIHYNGKKWEKIEVPLGITVYVKDENGYLTETSVTKDRDNNITLLPKFDAGWY